MRCTRPKTVGFKTDGKTISWSLRTHSKQFALFQLPCTKCLACRLDYARQWAIRCIHEAQMHPNNCFITLTYSNEHLTSDKLVYRDFQLFMKKLRKKIPDQKIGVFVTGEYGEENKRPHWHAIIFNWSPPDPDNPQTTPRGDTTWESKTLTDLWAKGKANFGEVTIHSAGYCARYAAKKLVHGHDQAHDYHPISKKSSHQAIGKSWLEKYYKDIFNYGELVYKKDDKYVTSSIPRYYEKWLKKYKPTEWAHYVTQIKQRHSERASNKENTKLLARTRSESVRRSSKGILYTPSPTSNQHKEKILQQRITNKLQKFLKL